MSPQLRQTATLVGAAAAAGTIAAAATSSKTSNAVARLGVPTNGVVALIAAALGAVRRTYRSVQCFGINQLHFYCQYTFEMMETLIRKGNEGQVPKLGTNCTTLICFKND